MIKALVKIEKVRNKSIVFLFILAIYIPSICSILKLGVNSDKSIELLEQRQAAKFPTLKLLIIHPPKYLREIEKYYNDHFLLRENLIQFYGRIKVLWLSESSAKVIVGKKGWLFLKNSGDDNELNYYRAVDPFTPKDLAEWKSAIEKRNNLLASHGIHYLLVIAPNKTTIYPEFLPESINRFRQESRLDQLIKYMKLNSHVKILDLRASLRLAKANQLLYCHGDTHWNDLGAFIAYQEIMKSLTVWYPNLRSLSMSDFKLQTGYCKGDLISMVGLIGIIKDKTPELIPRIPRRAQETNDGIDKSDLTGAYPQVATKLEILSLPKAVMFHDSFTDRLVPFLSEDFKRIVYVRRDSFDTRVVEREHPNVVIQEIVERKLMRHPDMAIHHKFFNP